MQAAGAAGLDVVSADVVSVMANALVRLEPGPVAARVSDVLSGIRDVEDALARESRICRVLSEAGAPVPTPLSDEPFLCDDRVVTLWEWIDADFGAGEPEAGAAALATCHDALMHVDEALMPWAMLHEARDALVPLAPAELRDELDALGHKTLGAVDDDIDRLRPVHGDPHPGNLLWTVRGPLLIDWEDAHLAPLEWDLACLVGSARVFGDDFGWSETALAAYPGQWDAGRLERCVLARAFQGVAYTAALVGRRPEIAPRLDARLAWLRERLL